MILIVIILLDCLSSQNGKIQTQSWSLSPIHPAVSFLCAFLEAIPSSWNSRIHAENATHAPSSWGQPPDLPGEEKASSQEGADQSLLRPSPGFAHRLVCVDYHRLRPQQVGEDRQSSERGSFVWCCDSGDQSLTWWSSQLLPVWKPSSEPATPILAFWSCWKDLMRAVEPKLCHGFCMHFAKSSPSPLRLFSHGPPASPPPGGKRPQLQGTGCSGLAWPPGCVCSRSPRRAPHGLLHTSSSH